MNREAFPVTVEAASVFQPWLSAADAIKRIRNIFCVGRNYVDHAKELGNAVPTKPLIFGKSTHSLVPASGSIELPKARTNIHHELEIVLFIGRDYTPGASVSGLVSGVGLGLDLTDRDAQNQLKAAGQPWEFAKAFRNSAVVTDFYRIDGLENLTDIPFSLEKDGVEVQRGVARDMLFDFQKLADYVGEHFGLAEGDILFTGTPAGVGSLQAGQSLKLTFGSTLFGTCTIAQS
jgi:fumarylpyruvate hydrolase